MSDRDVAKWGVRQTVSVFLLIGVAVLGNVFAPRLFTGFNYLFGSIGVMLILRLFGVGWAIVAALLAAAWCKQLFGHFYPLFWLGLEPLFVYLWLKRRPKDTLIMADTAYWIITGVPLIAFFFLTILKVAVLGTTAAGLMYATIGITNALIATLFLNHLPIERFVWPKRAHQPVSVAQFLFQVLMLAVVLPAMLLLVVTGRSRETMVKQKMFDLLEIKSRQAGYEIRQKIFDGTYPRTFGPEQRAQLNLESVDKVLQGIRSDSALSLHLMANQDEVIASTDPMVAKTARYNPLILGKAVPTERDKLYHRMPSNNPPLPLWQRAGKSVYMRIYPIPGTTVYVIAEAPFAPYQAQILRGHRNTLAGLLLYLAVGAVFAVIVARRIATPLVVLSKTTTDLPGRLMTEDMVWPGSSIAEVGKLIGNVQEMAHTLAGQFREIALINAGLETRVAERTRELSESNQSLRQEINERIRAELERDLLMRELTAKNKELESIIYVTSHDLRSPLVNIQGFSRKLAKSCAVLTKQLSVVDLPPELRQEVLPLLTESMPRSVEFIAGSVEKMDNLLTGLLRLSRLGRAALIIENLDMNQLMGKITNSLAYQIESCGAQVLVDDLLPCQGDAVQVGQVFTNLLDNAIKYRSPDRVLEIHISNQACDGEICYCVQDNGIGIHPDYQGQVWELFHRINPRNIPGEGLGLTASRRILERLNGTIHLESEEGAGCRFFVKLPAQKS